MNDLSQHDPIGRFQGCAEIYARCRPAYPEEALAFIVEHCRLGRNALVVDVGSGTGILTRQLALRGFRVLGIEPNAQMRASAEVEALPPNVPAPVYYDGRAEATGLESGSVDAVVAGQAFHWFDTAASLREFHRVLRPDGWVVLIWNERDPSDAFTAAYGAVIRSTPEAASIEDPRARSGEALLASPLFHRGERRQFANEQVLEEEGVLGRAFSATYAPREPAAAERFAAALRAVFRRYAVGDKVILRYVTSVYLGQRSAGSA
jgi:SAM-dependent methyltransferase